MRRVEILRQGDTIATLDLYDYLRRGDAFELIERVTRGHGRELHVLTNGILLQGVVLDRLRAQGALRDEVDEGAAIRGDKICFCHF